jgi:hypothetical protein
MRTLASLQQAFQDYVHEPEDKLGAIVEDIRSDERVSAEDRLGIYSNAYRLRLLEALLTDYPGLHGLAGDEEFDLLGRAFIAAHNSPYYNLRWYGGELPNFLRASEEYRQYSVLAAMADFELAIATAFDAADDPVLGIEDIARVAPEAWGDMRFRPHPSVQRVDLEWDVIPLWKAVNEEREGEHPARNDSPVNWLVWRADLRTQFRSMSADESAAFDALRKGSSFGEICEVLLEWHDAEVVAMRAAELLKQWTQTGMLSELTVAEPT